MHWYELLDAVTELDTEFAIEDVAVELDDCSEETAVATALELLGLTTLLLLHEFKTSKVRLVITTMFSVRKSIMPPGGSDKIVTQGL